MLALPNRHTFVRNVGHTRQDIAELGIDFVSFCIQFDNTFAHGANSLLLLRSIRARFAKLADLGGRLVALCLELLAFGDALSAPAVEFLKGFDVEREPARGKPAVYRFKIIPEET